MSYKKQEQNLFDQSLIISNKKYLNTEKISNLVKNHYVVFYLKAGVFILAPPPPGGPYSDCALAETEKINVLCLGSYVHVCLNVLNSL